MRTTLSILAALALFCAGATAAAGDPPETRYSMFVHGTITVDAHGDVLEWALDDAEKLPEPVRELLARNVDQWRFEPVHHDGQPVRSRSAMFVRVTAEPLPDERLALRVHSASFSALSDASLPIASSTTDTVKRPRPRYPASAVRAGVSATVYLVARIDAAGKVMQVAAEQVNLNQRMHENEQKRWRRVFADNAAQTVRKWQFVAAANSAAAPRTMRVPIVYRLRRNQPTYGVWQAYLPGPRASISWLDDDAAPGSAADALPGGSIALAGAAVPRLLNLEDNS